MLNLVVCLLLCQGALLPRAEAANDTHLEPLLVSPSYANMFATLRPTRFITGVNSLLYNLALFEPGEDAVTENAAVIEGSNIIAIGETAAAAIVNGVRAGVNVAAAFKKSATAPKALATAVTSFAKVVTDILDLITLITGSEQAYVLIINKSPYTFYRRTESIISGKRQLLTQVIPKAAVKKGNVIGYYMGLCEYVNVVGSTYGPQVGLKWLIQGGDTGAGFELGLVDPFDIGDNGVYVGPASAATDITKHAAEMADTAPYRQNMTFVDNKGKYQYTVKAVLGSDDAGGNAASGHAVVVRLVITKP